MKSVLIPKLQYIHLLAKAGMKAVEGFEPYEEKYLSYLINAETVEKRDYNLLREALYEMQQAYSTLLIEKLMIVLQHLKIRIETIDTVFDLGAGLGYWSEILSTVFPYASVYSVDRPDVSLKRTKQNIIKVNRDVYNLLQEQNIKGSSSTVFFMSEFLHCKDRHIDILKNATLQKSYVIINELEYDEFIDARLQQSGGGCIASSQLCSPNSTLVSYETLFKYYLYGRCPQ